MAKHRTRSLPSQLAATDPISVQIPIPMIEVLVDARQAFIDLCVATGRQTLGAMMETDRAALCGPKGKHDAERRAHRGGSTPSWITLGGRQIDVRRLRARSEEGELVLPSFAWAAQRDPLDTRTLEGIAGRAGLRRPRCGAALPASQAGQRPRAPAAEAAARRGPGTEPGLVERKRIVGAAAAGAAGELARARSPRRRGIAAKRTGGDPRAANDWASAVRCTGRCARPTDREPQRLDRELHAQREALARGSMIVRWAGSALAAAEKKFRRIREHRDLARLIAALDSLHPELRNHSMVA